MHSIALCYSVLKRISFSTTRFSPENMKLKDRIKRRFELLRFIAIEAWVVRKNRWGCIQDWSDVGEDKLEGPRHRGFDDGICSNEHKYPVPRIIDVFKRSNKTYIVMEFIENAYSLFDVWSDMTDDQKESICAQLKGYINELRSLVAPNPGRVESIDGSPCFDRLVACMERLGHLNPSKGSTRISGTVSSEQIRRGLITAKKHSSVAKARSTARSFRTAISDRTTSSFVTGRSLL
jgi:hypothetical protein